MPSYRSVSALTGKPGSDAEQGLGDSCRTHRRRTRGNLTKYFIKIPFIPPCLNYYKVDGVTVKPVSALQSMFRCQFHPQENKTRQNKYDVIEEHKREKVQSLRLRLKVLEMRIVDLLRLKGMLRFVSGRLAGGL